MLHCTIVKSLKEDYNIVIFIMPYGFLEISTGYIPLLRGAFYTKIRDF